MRVVNCIINNKVNKFRDVYRNKEEYLHFYMFFKIKNKVKPNKT